MSQDIRRLNFEAMRVGQYVLFAGIITALSGGIHYYLWTRLVRDAHWPSPAHQALTGLLIALAIMMPLAMISGRFLSGAAARGIAWVAFGWMGLMALSVSISFLGEFLRLGVRFAGVNEDRRELFSRGLAVVGGSLSLGLGLWGFRQALKALHVEELTIALKRLPKSLDGLTLVQVTDIHVGQTIRRPFIEHMVERVNALEPDIVAITGDLVDGSVDALKAEVAPLAKLRAKHGVYFVTGNHEYYSGAQEWVDHLRSLGITVLLNERVSIGDGDASFDLAGVTDWSARPDLPRALAGRDQSRELVLLAHQPKAAKEAEALGVGLQLSGHTHAGQLWPWTHAVRIDTPFVHGLYTLGDMQLYVSPGTGYWGPPMRIGTQAEITKVTLRSALG